MSEATDETWRTELASRESNGITVRLLWSRSTNLVTVAVDDAANDDYFELILDEHDRALDVFHHPFAHAAARGIEFRTGRPESEVLLDAA
jgi:nucleotide-binding universal stress UspA family protein